LVFNLNKQTVYGVFQQFVGTLVNYSQRTRLSDVNFEQLALLQANLCSALGIIEQILRS